MEKYILFFSTKVVNLRDDTGDIVLDEQCMAFEAEDIVHAINQLLNHYSNQPDEKLDCIEKYERSSLGAVPIVSG